MLSNKSLSRIGFSLMTLLIGAIALGQLPSDYPTLKGDNRRSGMNGQPNLTGPGLSLLHWFDPRTFTDLNGIFLDNTDVNNTLVSFPTQGPFDVPAFGSKVASATYNPLNPAPNRAVEWAWPAENQEASFPLIVPIRNVPQTIGATVYPVNFDSRFPAYVYTDCTPSAPGSDPRIGETPSDVRTFRYIFQGAPGIQKNYALYVWLPVGPTFEAGASIFPQRFYTYEIRFGVGGNNKYIDVVDTYATGGGWVRLGNGGAPTNAVFPWDGSNPITVFLYNTVARDGTGQLTMPHPVNNDNGVKKYLVYADAARAVPSSGDYVATPVTGHLDDLNPNSMTMIAAKNEYSVAANGADTRTVSNGVVTSRDYDTVNKIWKNRWTFRPVNEQGGSVLTMDNSVASVAGTFAPDTTSTRYSGADVQLAPIQAAADGTVNYAPTLNDGTYEVYAFLPGDNNGHNFGHAVKYLVTAEGSTFTYVVDQSQARGWVKLDERRFANTAALPLSVMVTNESADAGDLTREAYADAIRFVGERNQEITSTPVFATVGIRQPDLTIAQKKVAVVADEGGVIHCLDATGNGDGTTTEYWSYPSQVTPDPNQVAGQDGVGGLAEMPTGFEMSSAVVQHLGAFDRLYIGGRNGRVYCIDMAGRGDFTTRVAGTTQRLWTYPATYPTNNPVPSSTLGSFRGSIVYANGAVPTIYVPTTQGRMYALAAAGNTANKSTTVRWTFPALNQPTLGPIYMTPSVQFGQIYFGTLRKNDAPGRFFSLNADTGAQQWELNTGTVTADDFLASPAVVPYQTVTGVAAPGGIIYTVNQNRVFYALDALSGAILWQTSELGVGARGSITYTRLSAFNNLGIPTATPVVMVPTLDGRFVGLFASPDYTFLNRFGQVIDLPSKTVIGKRAYQYVTAGDTVVSSLSVAQGWMFGGDNAGFLYAFNNTSGNLLPGDQVPGEQSIVENDPSGDIFRKSKLKLLTRDAYTKLRLPTNDPNHLSYLQALSPANSFNRNPLAFEWGESAYILVYDFPFKTLNAGGNPVPPPIVNVSFNVNGRTVRGIAVEARQFQNLGGGNPPKLRDILPNIGSPAGPEGDALVDGYAILAFPFQGGGANALPPGDAAITFSISTQSLNANGAQQNIALDPSTSQVPFKMANPIAVSMDPTQPNAGIGIDVNPGGPERLINGSAAVGAVRKDLLGATTGWAQHGQTKSTTVYVYDTSMMGLLRPDGNGLDGVRLDRGDLARQGGSAGIFKRLDPILYPGFEDVPTNSPNTSIDYPDIPRQQIRATKDPNGDAENPLFNGVTLIAPLINDAGTLRVMQEGDKPEDRVFRPTPFELDVDVPKFQPPVDFSSVAAQATEVKDSLNRDQSSGYLQGYMSRLNLFVDSFQNGNLDISQREAYRSFNLATAVAPDEQLAVTTPTVDLGSLASGAGESPVARPGFNFNPTGAFDDRIWDPWNNRATAVYPKYFKEFVVQNRGNVNMLSLRLAKAYDSRFDNPGGAASPFPWKLSSPTSDIFAWLESGWQTNAANWYTGNVWSDLDWQFSPWNSAQNASRNVILQKARVTDRIPTTLTVNPRRRANPGIPAVDSPLFAQVAKWPVRNPRVGVTVPLGFPVGRYGERLRVIEDSNSLVQEIFPTWDILTPTTAETASDPTFDLFFNVRETRLTSSFTPGTARQMDDLATSPSSGFTNQQPTAVRDAFGSMVVAFSSNRPGWAYPADTVTPNGSEPWGIFIATLDSGWNFAAGGMSGPANQNPLAPLRDLDNWNPKDPTRWWSREVGNFPARSPDLLFNSKPGESVIAESVRYTNPSFPQMGQIDPFLGSTYQGMYMAFDAEAQKNTSAGRVTESKLMATIVTTAADGSVAAIRPFVMANDPYVAKGKPSVVQSASGAMVFYGGSSGGESRIYYTRINGQAFVGSSALPFGSGFESVSHPSAAAHAYSGFNSGQYSSVIDLTFNGKLRGRANNEVFLGRMPVVTNDRLAEIPADSGIVDPANAFLWQQVQIGERVEPDGTATYRSRGVVWNLNQRIYLEQRLPGTTPTNVLIDGYDSLGNYNAANDTRVYDQSTGIISYDTRLGGKAYLDPSLGTIRFSGATPAKNAELYLNYQPEFIRVNSTSTSGYAEASGLWDGRLFSDSFQWRRSDGTLAAGNDPFHNDRLVFTYTKAASGTGQAARPYISTFRLGVRLGNVIQTDANGNPVKLIISGNTGPFQIDPSQGRIYFTAADEDRQITVMYWGVDGSGNPITIGGTRDLTVQANATWVGERAEQPILIEQAVNEAGVTPFLDPFTYLNDRRPPLVWLFWSSTRSGAPDLYFESIAPRWSPVLLGK